MIFCGDWESHGQYGSGPGRAVKGHGAEGGVGAIIADLDGSRAVGPFMRMSTAEAAACLAALDILHRYARTRLRSVRSDVRYSACAKSPLFVLIFLAGLVKVRDNDAGVASSLVTVGQQVGGSIGLAAIGTVAWSAVASSLRSPAAAAARAGVHATGARAAALQTQMYDHALATGFSRGYLVPAGNRTRTPRSCEDVPSRGSGFWLAGCLRESRRARRALRSIIVAVRKTNGAATERSRPRKWCMG
jgi:hypothetical protein